MQRRRRGLHLDGDGSAQAEAGACKQWSVVEWLDGGKVVEARRQLDDATTINGGRQRWSELATDGDDGTEERARPGLHDAAGRMRPDGKRTRGVWFHGGRWRWGCKTVGRQLMT